MASIDEFVHITTGPGPGSIASTDTVSQDYFGNTDGKRQYTEGLITASIRAKYPKHHLTVSNAFLTDLIAFANARDDVICFPHEPAGEDLIERDFIPPARRYNDETGGGFSRNTIFGCYAYVFQGNTFLVYIVDGHDGPYHTKKNYILVEGLKMEDAQNKTDNLLRAVSSWAVELHGEVFVFDNGFWQKNKELWQNVQKSNWEDVILAKDKKDSIIEDVVGFFDAEKKYEEFGVPWKRGVIFYGPPGNGKTISTKALMHDISRRVSPAVESLYVKTFKNFQGPEYGIRQIFLKARQMAPCLLIFEDIDSFVSTGVRSYFLNEVDGLESNHGILMIGSTNHLEELDPGIAKRPSRFDRKYLFDVPTHDERIQYADYWRHKLRNNKKVDFPEKMSARIADITTDFSFAYMKEAFVAALLVLAAKDDKMKERSREDDLSSNILWKELKKQVESLRKEMDDEGTDGKSNLSLSGMWPAINSVDDESRIWDSRDERRTRPIDINTAMPRYF